MTDYVTAYKNPTSMYHREAIRLAASLTTEATIVGGVIRWNSNNRVVPQDCAILAAHIGLPVCVATCDDERAADLRAFLKTYDPTPTAEDMAEMRAAFGAGTTVVNVLTGRRTRV
jgi:hypothetical protein